MNELLGNDLLEVNYNRIIKLPIYALHWGTIAFQFRYHWFCNKNIIIQMQQSVNQDNNTFHTSNLQDLQNYPRKVKKDSRIKIDISKTQYPLLNSVARNQMGWKIWTREDSKEEISLYWVDTYVTDEQMKRVKTYQKINHFPGSQNLGKKNLLSSNIARLKRIAPKQFKFYPQTFNLPSQMQQFERFCQQKQEGYCIVKPCSDSQGRGIYLTNKFDFNSKEEVVVQQYITNPLLIDQMKFDLRIYVLLKSISPLKIYIYREGLSRFATCPYQKPARNNQENMMMHLTNYAINKVSPDYIFNKSYQEDNTGHKRSYTAAMQVINTLGGNIVHLQAQIDQIIVKTIMTSYSSISKRYKQMRDGREDHDSVCFQILGFDILIKDNFEPILLEVNHSPSFCTQTPLDLVIKKCLILDTLNMLVISHEDKINYFKSKIQHDPLHVNLNPQLSKISKNSAREPEHEQLGAYRKIYPLQNTSQNQDLIKIYEDVFKNCKIEKIYKTRRSLFPPAHKVCLCCPQGQAHVDSAVSQNSNNGSFFKALTSFRNHRIKKSKEPRGQSSQGQMAQSKQFDLGIDIQKIRKQQFLEYEMKVRKDREKQKKKYILPMPVNNINIKLDEKYYHVKRQSKSNNTYYYGTQFNPFKIHSLINEGALRLQSERKKPMKGKLKLTTNELKQFSYEQFKKTTSPGFSHFVESNEYTVDLKERIEKMKLTRLTIHRTRRIEKSNFIIIQSKSLEKKGARTADSVQ